MLKGVPAVITSDLLKILDDMGHGDELVVADANFPAHSMGRPLVSLKSAKATDILSAISGLIDLDTYETPCAMIAVCKGDTLDPAVEEEYRAALKYTGVIDRVERFAFYERSRRAYAIVQTGEMRKYGCVILKKGCMSA